MNFSTSMQQNIKIEKHSQHHNIDTIILGMETLGKNPRWENRCSSQIWILLLRKYEITRHAKMP